MEQKTKIIAGEGKQELIITREFNLPLELLFKAYQEPKLFEQWMGTRVLKMENKRHGSYELETTYNGNVVFSASGTIHEFIVGERIVRTFEMHNSEIGVQLEFLEFEKLTNNTSKLTIQSIYKSEKHREKQLQMAFAYGINKAHDRLQEIANK